jgi:hypothetical protein
MKHIKQQDGFNIYFEELPEDMAVEDLLSFEETGVDHSSTIKKVNNGTYAYFTAHVVAEKNGVKLADDYLGGCIYKDTDEFINAKGDYFDDMVATVVADAQKKIKQLCEA